MEQLTQSLKDGKMELMEVPFPALNPGTVLVRNHFSVISAGTEGKTVKDARLGYIGKARARKAEVRKVIQSAKTNGVLNTYRMVMNKLDAPAPLGYCCAGEVMAIASDVTAFKIGDRVACGGNSANHAEVVAVPVNLCVKIPEQVHAEQAAFATLGAIALQGIRQADLRLGENCVVIGLGLIGQLTLQMLAAAGIRAVGIDLDEFQVGEAVKNGAHLAFKRDDTHLVHAIEQLTQGNGVDAVIITAGTSSTDPINLAGELCRQKGKVIIVGAVPTGFERPNYFKKELDLRMSCSYGPGRYDAGYEEHGIDYPYGYVRWTENRNMDAFLQLIADKRIDPSSLISKRFSFNDALKAYDLVVNRNEPFLGLVLTYDTHKSLKQTIQYSSGKNESLASESPAVSFIGAGSFAQNFLLPAVKGKVVLRGIATARPSNAGNMATKYGFAFSSGEAEAIFTDASTNTVFVATRHDTHAEFVTRGLKSGKHVFVEKPLCMNESELREIAELAASTGSKVMVGFNRRFAPFIIELKKRLPKNGSLPVSIQYRINAGIVPPSHWIHDPETGGGRLIGEACHFIDLAAFIAGSPIVSVSAVAMPDAHQQQDTFVVSLEMANGSIASISYFSNGNKEISKEHLEVYASGMIAEIDDFTNMTITGNGPRKNLKLNQDKGHAAGVHQFLDSIRTGKPCPIPFDAQFNAMLATFKAKESIALHGERIAVAH